MIQHIAFGLATALLSLALTVRLVGPDLPALHRYTNGGYAVSPEAFHGLGRLAFLKEGQIHILDGATDTVQVVENSEGAGDMAWSQDGAWLAFVRDGELMIVATDRAVQPVDLPGPVNGFAWSPASNVLAVSLNPGEPAQTGGAIWLVTDPAEPKAQPLLTLDRPVGAVTWSPDGETLAYVTTLPSDAVELRSDALEVMPAAGGEPARWYVADQAGIELASWWPDGKGILFWAQPLHNSSIAANGLPLQSLAVGTTEPIALPTMLLYPDWLSWHPSDGPLAMVAGGGRTVWDGKSMALCDTATGECRTLPQLKEQVNLDASWSPGGEQIALVRADRRPGAWNSTSEEEIADWVKSRTLWLTDPEGKNLREVASAGRGIYGPAWSKDGQHLVYVKDSALWVLDLEADRASKVVTLKEEVDRFGFCGAVNWWNRMAWYQG